MILVFRVIVNNQKCVWVVVWLPQRLKPTFLETFFSLRILFWEPPLEKFPKKHWFYPLRQTVQCPAKWRFFPSFISQYTISFWTSTISNNGNGGVYNISWGEIDFGGYYAFRRTKVLYVKAKYMYVLCTMPSARIVYIIYILATNPHRFHGS